MKKDILNYDITQIIWRWTRLFDWKDFFTILDFTWATNKFYDDERDGEPETIEEKNPLGSAVSPLDKEEQNNPLSTKEESEWNEQEDWDQKEPFKKIYVQLWDDRVLKITNIDIRYIDESGKPITAEEFLKKLIGKLPNFYESEEQLRTIWSNPDTREELLYKLAEIGIGEKHLEKLKEMFDAEDCDIFDVLAHISFNSDLKKRVERVEHVRWTSILFEQYEDLKKDFLLSIKTIWTTRSLGNMKT